MNAMKLNAMKLAIPLAFALAYAPAQVLAAPILGSNLASFAVLSSATLTNVPTSAVVGNIGVSAGTAIVGFTSAPNAAVSDAQVTGGSVHSNTGAAASAQGQLTSAITSLGLMGSGTTLANADLSGLTLTPGVYTVSAGVSNLTGALTLDGLGNANAAWVFQMASTLITSPGSSVKLVNSGSGAGVFWDVRSSATLGTTTSFLGNILAYDSITLNTGATIGCGSALANSGAVTMISNTIGIGCGGGLDVLALGATPTFLPYVAAVPEPETYAMMLAGLGLLGFMARRRKQKEALLSLSL
jgi:hypothetical protein